MLRYKTTIVVIAIGSIGIGAGWLMRGRVRDEAPRRAVEQTGKQPKSDESVPDSRQAQRDELKYRLNMLDKREREREDRMGKARNQVRLELAEARDALRLRERELDLDREDRQDVLKPIMLRISVLQKQLQSIDDKTEAGSNERKKSRDFIEGRRRETSP